MKIKPFFIVIIICIQLVIIGHLFIKIKEKISGVIKRSISPIKSKNIITGTNKKLKYFYEHLANSTETESKDFLPNKVAYTINADSLNEQRNYEIIKKQNVFRIIALGDSFTFGDGVSTKDNWTELLENELNANDTCKGKKTFEVINLGVRGYDTEYEVERYRIRGQKYNPDLVIWTFGDIKRFKEAIYELALQLKEKNKEYVLKKEIELYGEKSIHITSYEEIIFQVASGLNAKQMKSEDIIRQKIRLIDLFDSFYKGKILYLEINNENNENKNLVKEILKDRMTNGKYYDTYTFDNEKERLIDYHFNMEGHKKMMSNIIVTLFSNKLIPCFN